MNEFVDTEIETQTKKKQEVNIEIESETEKQRDVISEVEGHKDGGGNEGILEEVEATVDAVDTKDTEPREGCVVPRA
jgi:hypothetical protein